MCQKHFQPSAPAFCLTVDTAVAVVTAREKAAGLIPEPFNLEVLHIILVPVWVLQELPPIQDNWARFH